VRAAPFQQAPKFDPLLSPNTLLPGGVPNGVVSPVPSSVLLAGVVGEPISPPLMAEEPAPMHGCPVIGFVFTDVPGPANVPGKVPGVVGDTGFSGPWGKTSELEGFCNGSSREPCACASPAYPASIKSSNIAETLHLRCFGRIESLPIDLPEGALPHGRRRHSSPALVPCFGSLLWFPALVPCSAVGKKRIKVAVACARVGQGRHLLAIEGAYGSNEAERGWLREEGQLCPCKPTQCCTRPTWPPTAKIIVRNATHGCSHQIGRNISMSVVCGTRGRAKNAATNLRQRSSFPHRHKRRRTAKLRRHPRALYRQTPDIGAIVH
jgi:hypothetical protein